MAAKTSAWGIIQDWLEKGGEGSGWHAPPKGTHVASAKAKPKVTWNPDDLPPQWKTTMHDKDGLIKPEAVGKGVAKAVEERPSRATHGHTATNAFYLVNDKVYAWNDYNKIPRGERGQAIPVHSHSGENWQGWTKKQGRLEDISPLNADDIKLWTKDVIKGRMAPAQALIAADGRMSILEILPSTDPKVFKLGVKRLEKMVGISYGEAGEYLKKNPGATTNDFIRLKIRRFVDKYGLRYIEDATWRTTPELKKYG